MQLQALISTQSYRRNGGVGEALRECVMVLDEEVCKKFAQSVGTTATLALLNGNELVVAGVGDSRYAYSGKCCTDRVERGVFM